MFVDGGADTFPGPWLCVDRCLALIGVTRHCEIAEAIIIDQSISSTCGLFIVEVFDIVAYLLSRSSTQWDGCMPYDLTDRLWAW